VIGARSTTFDNTSRIRVRRYLPCYRQGRCLYSRAAESSGVLGNLASGSAKSERTRAYVGIDVL
jgi:hypothetical protein